MMTVAQRIFGKMIVLKPKVGPTSVRRCRVDIPIHKTPHRVSMGGSRKPG